MQRDVIHLVGVALLRFSLIEFEVEAISRVGFHANRRHYVRDEDILLGES